MVVALTLAVAGFSVDASAFSPDEEGRNFSKTEERARYEHMLPEYRALLAERGARSETELLNIAASDSERNPYGNLCAQHMDGCAGDVRLWAQYWRAEGRGLVEDVLYTSRTGATISGHVWATREGPPVRPAVVITPGSVQAPEELYGFAAATLAKRGYVVLTYDVQTQGRSDTNGGDQDRGAGAQAQDPNNFINGTTEGLDFLLSTPGSPYRVAPLRAGVSYQGKQERRVAAKFNRGFNPLHGLVDPDRVGLVGHSLGAYAVSKVGNEDARVDAIVAFDNLNMGGAASCPAAGPPGVPAIAPRVPALGMAADYGLTPTPYNADPGPECKNDGFARYKQAGVDAAQLNIRGGTHYEFSYIPNPGFPATLRGMDLASWYAGAWLDKYVKRDPGADARVLSDRWRSDARGREVDPAGDGNLFSKYYRSRVALTLADGSPYVCDDVRAGCAPPFGASDGEPAGYSYLREASTTDAASDPGGGGGGGGTAGRSVRGGKCVRALRVSRRLSLSRSRRRLGVVAAVALRSRISVRLTGRHGRRVGGGSRVHEPGGRRLSVRIVRSAAPGRYVLRMSARCGEGLLRRTVAVALTR